MRARREFVTPDLYLCAFLSIYLNQFPSFKVEFGKTMFIFGADGALYKGINAYNGGATVNAFEFAQQIKRIRGEMLARKGMGMDKGERKTAKRKEEGVGKERGEWETGDEPG